MSASLLFLATRDSFVIASSEALYVRACVRACKIALTSPLRGEAVRRNGLAD